MTAATVTATSIVRENYLLYAFLRTRQQDGVIAHQRYGKGCNLLLVCQTHLADALVPHGNANVGVIVIIMEHIGDPATLTEYARATQKTANHLPTCRSYEPCSRYRGGHPSKPNSQRKHTSGDQSNPQHA